MKNRITFAQGLLAKLWWGPLRRPFEAGTRRVLRGRRTVVSGPLKGCRFKGGLAQTLGVYELHMQRVLLENLGRGAVFYDVGANNGYITLLGAQIVGESGFVYAFEPVPDNQKAIARVLEENHLINARLQPEAVSHQTGSAELRLGTGSAATPSLLERDGVNAAEVLQVATLALDDFVETNRWPNLIKVDVEGAETLVVQGATHLMSAPHAPVWLIEVHDAQKDEQVSGVLREHGYDVQPLGRMRVDEYPCHILARKK
jgi:FkbM family methyltransferase